MSIHPSQTTYFKHARFATRLPNAYRYAPSHYWIREMTPGCFRVGLTKFAARMLGDFVEISFFLQAGDPVVIGQELGTIEGFKAVASVYGAVHGSWRGANQEIETRPELVDTDPYDHGWLYEISGVSSADWLDVEGYAALLKSTISRMLEQPEEGKC